MIRLFEVVDGLVKPTEHCYKISWLKLLTENYTGEKLTTILAYIFYMSYIGEENPYFNIKEDLKEETIIEDLNIDFSLEEDDIIDAVAKAEVLYKTPTVRAYVGITTMLDNITDYITTAKVEAGRDGNITSLIKIAKEFDGIRQSYKGVAKDLAAEQQTHVRGGQELAYDQEQ